MKLILTRPAKDAMPLAEKLRQLGHEPRLVPLLEIVPRLGVIVSQGNWQALCITSANGLGNKEVLAGLKDVPLLCVGPQSLAAARAAGFTRASAHGGDVEGLTAHIVAHLKTQDGPLLYLSGAATSGDLEGRLRAHGFSVTRVIVYDALRTAAADLSHAVTGADAVLLYSPRSAKLWLEQVEDAGVSEPVQKLTHLCLSQAVAKALPQTWPKTVASTPDEKAMLAVLETLERRRKQE
jgi:uroporphyrinogen-III synthase